MPGGGRTILRDAAVAYFHSLQRYEQHFGRDEEKADEALSEMQQMERDLTVVESGTSWRKHPTLAGARR